VNLPEVVQHAVSEEIESHRVMYQYLFTENKKKESLEEDEGEIKK
jgi:hypothetical protein